MTGADRRSTLTGQAVTRGILGGLGLVLVVFAGLLVVGGLAVSRSVDDVERSGDLTRAYLTAQDALSRADAVEDALEDERLEAALGGEGSPALRRRAERLPREFDRAAADLRGALTRLIRDGAPRDQALGRRAAALARDFVGGFQRYFESLRRGDRAAAATVHEEIADPAQDALQPLVNGTGLEYAVMQLDEIDELERTESRLLTATLVAVPIGVIAYLLLLVVFAAYRRRLDRAAAAEVRNLREALYRDALTELPNRRALHRDIDAAAREGASLALIDVVGLRAVDDARGLLAGDAVLRTVATTLTDVVGDRGALYQVERDGFAVVLHRESAVSAAALVADARSRIEDAGDVSLRAGFAPSAEGRHDELTRRADLAITAARRRTRGFLVYAPDLESDADEEHAAEAGQEALTSALAQAVDAKDSYTRSHCETVAMVSALIAERLGMDPGTLARVRRAGLLHDVGKIGVPDSILQKPGALDDTEWEVMRTHSRLGADILSAAGLHDEARWVLSHHERVDGRGYPAGLAGSEIPLEARILMVADTFEAITADRPYRAAASPEEAVAELRRHAGSQFDERCVEALAAVVGAGWREAPDAAGALVGECR